MAEACCGADAVGLDDHDGFLDRWRTMAAVVAALAWVVGTGASLAGASTTSLIAFVTAVMSGGATFVPQTVRGLARNRLGVGLLMTIAGVGALLLGQLREAAALAFLFSVSEALEEWAITKSRRGLRAVLKLVPDSATIREGADLLTVETSAVVVGNTLVVRAGERIATDGVVVSGHSLLDVSAVTGESIPCDVGPGDAVLAGSVNGGGLLDIGVTAPAADSTLSRIVQAVEDAQDRKGDAQRLADRIARPLVPGILVLGVLIAGIGSLAGDPSVWVQRALVVLVAASPCAFAIAVPVTVFAAVGSATKSGLVIKGGAALEALATVRTVALDKTGTLTRNQPSVVGVATIPGITEDTVLTLAAALESHSDHPLASAVVAAAGGAGGAATTVTDVQAEIGSGLSGHVGASLVRVGKPGFIDASSLADDVRRFQADGSTVILVESAGTTVGAVAIRDELRPEARDVVDRLRRHHDIRVVMLSGDNLATATSAGQQAGINDIRAGLLPDEKSAAIEGLQASGPVAMVGDGINDAPALAISEVGIAMGVGGTDVALEAADVAIMGDHLTHLPDLIDHARRTRTIMLQNLVMSGAIIATLVPVAAFGWLGLGAVVAIHELAEIVVIVNALRARRDLTGPLEYWEFRSGVVVADVPASV